MDPAQRPGDIRGSDVAWAAVVVVGALVSLGFALAHARLGHRADVAAIDPGVEIAVAVRPVADVPAGATAGSGRKGEGRKGDARSGEAAPRSTGEPPDPGPQVTDAPANPLSGLIHPPSLPRAWRRKVPAVRDTLPSVVGQFSWPMPAAVEPEPVAPVEAPEPRVEAAEPDSIPSPQRPRKRRPKSKKGNSKDAGATDGGDPGVAEGAAAGETEGDAGLDGSVAGSTDGVGGEGGGEGEGEGAGEGAGGDAEVDPLFERAVAFYRARLVAWFSARFRVTGTGLGSAELAKHRVRVQIAIGEDLTVIDYTILSSDHPAFDQAARDTMDKLIGQTLPAPPENYPGAVQRKLTVTFTCTEDACD